MKRHLDKTRTFSISDDVYEKFDKIPSYEEIKRKITNNIEQYDFNHNFIKRWDLSNQNEINALTEEYTIFLKKYNLPNLSAEDMIQEIKLNKINL